MKAYVDSSFLFSLYAIDVHSLRANEQERAWRGALLISSLVELEFFNALELRVFRGDFTRSEADRIRSSFEIDLRTGVWGIIDVAPSAFEQARKLISKTTASTGCRTADVLHIAIATEAGADTLLSFDQRQRQLAKRAGLGINR